MPQYGAREMAKAFRTVRGNTIQIARDIPEDQYDFVPAPGTKSVSQLLRHIAYGVLIHYDFHRDKRITTLAGYDFSAIGQRAADAEAVPRTKDEIIALLETEGEQFASWLESLSPAFLDEVFTDPTGGNPRTRLEHLLGAKEHEMHHRGQLMLMERMLGVVPHLTRAMQERIAARRRASLSSSASGASGGSAVSAS